MGDEARRIEKLRLLLDITRRMTVTTDLTELLNTIIGAACEVLDCERATIFLYDQQADELYSRVATGVQSIRFPAGRGIAGAAARARVIVNVADAYADPRFNPDVDRQTGFRTRNLLSFPLENLDGALMGVLQALNHAPGPFTRADEDLARDLAAQAGIALHRQTLLEQYAQKQRMARDLELARKIQQQLFPAASPQIPGYEIAGWNQCADETGGDCYDFIRLEGERWAFLLADASGHGIGAALVMAQCRALLRAMLSVTQDLPVVACRVNQLLSQDLAEGRFVTAFVGILDADRHRLEYFAAGQGPLLFVSPAGLETRNPASLPFAIVPQFDCVADHYDFTPGSMVVLLTDGFYEAENPDGEQFAEQRLFDFVRRRANLPLETLVRQLQAEIDRFTQHAPQADDLTALLIRRSH